MCYGLRLVLVLVAAIVLMGRCDKLEKLIDSVYSDFVNERDFMGISVGVVTPEGIRYFNYGVQNQTSLAVNENTIFSINSMTKVFTAIALADHVVNKNTVKIENRIQPLIPDHKMPIDDGKDILFLDLVTHWSGLPTRPDNWVDPDADDVYSTYTDELFFEYLGNYTFIDLHLRRQYWYSNLAFGLCAYILSSEIDNSDFNHLMHSTIFDPLNMDRSGLVIDEKSDSQLAVGHETDGTSVTWGWSCETVLGSWAIRSTAADMTKFLQANIKADSDDSTPLYRAMNFSHQRQRPTDEDGYSIGLGWRIEDSTNTRMKSGSGDGFECNMLFNSEHNLGLVVLSNSYIDSPHDTTTTSEFIFKELLKMY